MKRQGTTSKSVQTIHLGVWITPEKKRQFAAVAERRGKTASGLMRELIESALHESNAAHWGDPASVQFYQEANKHGASNRGKTRE